MALPAPQFKIVPQTSAMSDELTLMGSYAFRDNLAHKAMRITSTPDDLPAMLAKRRERAVLAEEKAKAKAARGESSTADAAETLEGPEEAHNFVVVDTSLPPEPDSACQEGAIVAQARWQLNREGVLYTHSWEDFYLPGGNKPAYKAFTEGVDGLRNRNVGGRRLWYLASLYSNPKYQGRGAAKYAVQWGCNRADEMGLDAYLDATEAGKGLYEKCGFQTIAVDEMDVKPFGVEGVYRTYGMLRPLKGKTDEPEPKTA